MRVATVCGASGGMNTSFITIGITPELHDSCLMFIGNTLSFIFDTAVLTRSRVVAGGGPFRGSQSIGFGGFSSFLGAGFLACGFLLVFHRLGSTARPWPDRDSKATAGRGSTPSLTLKPNRMQENQLEN